MSTIVQKTEIEDKFQISPNSKFDILPHRGITLLENTAVSTQYAKVFEKMSGSNSATLTYQLGERLFLDRGVFLEVDVPLVLTPTTPFATAPVAADYHILAGGFRDIAFRQYGILSCLDQLSVQFNNNPVTTLTNIQRCMEMTPEYGNGLMINKHFPASQPDRFVSYDMYSSDGSAQLETLNEDGDNIRMYIPAVSEENVFTGGYSNSYNSRRPAFKFAGGTTTALKVQVKCWMYIPFSFFATSDAETSLYGINTLTITPTFVNDFVKRLFVTKGVFWSSIDFDSGNQAKHQITMRIKTYLAPDYIQKEMIDRNGLPKPYRLGHNRIYPLPPKTLSSVTSLSKGNIAISDQVTVGSIPKHVYIGIHPTSVTGATNTPNFKGRINSIQCTIGNETTVIGPSSLLLFNLCKGNGLEKDYESAMLTNGFVVKLDVSKDLSVGGSLIGANIPTTMQFTVNFDSLEKADRVYELRLICTFPGQLVYDNREFKVLTSLVLSNAPYDISNQAAALYAELSPKIMTIGAGVFGDIWTGVKKGASAGVKWLRDNPDKVAALIGKGVRALAGGNVPYQQNMAGGSSTLLLGAGSMGQNPFK